MATSLSPSLNDGFDKAKRKVRALYQNFDNKISGNLLLNYNEKDIEYDIRRLLTEFPTDSSQQFELLEQNITELMGVFLLTRLYEGQNRLSNLELQNLFGDILRKLWKDITDF
ncbi:hypothetical protein ACFSR6_01645 [Pedobacter vanadiisoli]|uniref:Uncharacterized protein n=1 Tax=Pedobacter vanadiisoli TaxID=1761975 RepID=A0ABW5MFE4_9SPHI